MNPRIRLTITMLLIAVFAFVVVPVDLQADSPFDPDCEEWTVLGSSNDDDYANQSPLIGLFNHSNTIEGFDGDDDMYGQDCRDLLIGGPGEDELYGGAKRDILRGGYDDDILEGGDGNDILVGGPDDDTLDGGDGSDIIFGGDGIDIIDGGTSPGDHDICIVEPGIDTWVNCEEVRIKP